MPAAAVIPAPIAYIKFVAVKTLVVEVLLAKVCRLIECVLIFASINPAYLAILSDIRVVTLRKLECSKQAQRLEYSSME